MSKLSIYETGWIDLVFENRNKEYGAYKLRQDSAKTSLIALISGVMLLCLLMTIPKVIHYFSPDTAVATSAPEIIDHIVQLSKIKPNVPKPIEALPAVKSIATTEIVKMVQLRKPQIVQAALATPDIAKNIKDKTIVSPDTDGSGIISLNSSFSESNGSAGNANPAIDNGNAIVNTVSLDKLPEYPGGINKFYLYVGNNFEKPEIESVETIRIFISFVIEKDGKMSDIKVLKDSGYGLGKEAVRVLKSLRTKWTPGMLGGLPIRTAYNLPISVQMQ
ncbi:protein TonB [Flavobacterium sp. PL11]|uniref:energy transducer TonB n=1 Tax=Flavobacterium sp. PL11 TaxID=3071717 RepID=UPI002E0C8342|nr:protein TonB [Flavobacterium sp. PL11]